MLALELAIVVVLIALNSVLALSELAVVSARRPKLRSMVERGSRGAVSALELATNPGRFLSTVQVGITLIGVLSGAFSGVTLGERLAEWLASAGIPYTYAGPIGIGTVVVFITYLSVIVGELVPKQLALRDPERFAAAVAPIMVAIARVGNPIITFFDVSGQIVLRLLGVTPRPEAAITDEEIRILVAEAERTGVIEPEERSMIAGVMRLGDREVGAIMTPRSEVDMIDLSATPREIRRVIRNSVHTRLPAHRASPDEVIGIVQAKDLLDAYLSRRSVDPREYVRPAPVIPDSVDALSALATLKQSAVHMALVHDEYGIFKGVVTVADILEAIAGGFRTEEGSPEVKKVRRADGSWLLAGDLAVDEMAELLHMRLPEMPGYHTLAGFLLAKFGRIPEVGEEVAVQGWRFEVVDLDGRRIDKVLAQRIPPVRRQAL